MRPLPPEFHDRAAPLQAAAAQAGERRCRRCFWILVGGAVLVYAALVGVVWLAVASGLPGWVPPVLAVLSVAIGLGMVVLAAGLALAANGRVGGAPRFWRGVLGRLFPLVEVLSRALRRGGTGDSAALSWTDRVRHAFIQLNNELVLREAPQCAPEQLLILLPHCLQASHCPLRLTHNMDNCRRCGRCTLRDFLALRDRLGVKLAVAPGGTIARRIVRRDRPRVIVAVACERDLASGILDTSPLPVFGVLNERPAGPCMDTTVGMDRVETAVRRFITPA